MRRKLTHKTVETITNDGPKRIEIFDSNLPGFGVRVGVSGHKSWFVVTHHQGRVRRFTLGPYPRISLSEAREAARKVMNEVRLDSGYLPSCDSPTLSVAIEQFIQLYARPKNRGWLGTKRLLERNFVPLLETPLAEIRRPHVVRVLDGIMARGRPGTANHALSAIKKLFAWSLDRGMIEVHPLVGLTPPGKKVSRDRVLNKEEIRQLLTLVDAEGYPFGHLYLLLLYTGQRRGEVAGMRWSEIDRARRIWTIPAGRSKNGTAHEVPLANSVVDILAAIPRFLGSDFVFTTTGTTPISGFGRAKERVELLLGASDWRVHDLRRTAATGMARLGVAPHVIEKILNHKTGQISGVAAVYNRHGYESEKRHAITKWSDWLATLQASKESRDPRDTFLARESRVSSRRSDEYFESLSA